MSSKCTLTRVSGKWRVCGESECECEWKHKALIELTSKTVMEELRTKAKSSRDINTLVLYMVRPAELQHDKIKYGMMIQLDSVLASGSFGTNELSLICVPRMKEVTFLTGGRYDKALSLSIDITMSMAQVMKTIATEPKLKLMRPSGYGLFQKDQPYAIDDSMSLGELDFDISELWIKRRFWRTKNANDVGEKVVESGLSNEEVELLYDQACHDVLRGTVEPYEVDYFRLVAIGLVVEFGEQKVATDKLKKWRSKVKKRMSPKVWKGKSRTKKMDKAVGKMLEFEKHDKRELMEMFITECQKDFRFTATSFDGKMMNADTNVETEVKLLVGFWRMIFVEVATKKEIKSVEWVRIKGCEPYPKSPEKSVGMMFIIKPDTKGQTRDEVVKIELADTRIVQSFIRSVSDFRREFSGRSSTVRVVQPVDTRQSLSSTIVFHLSNFAGITDIPMSSERGVETRMLSERNKLTPPDPLNLVNVNIPKIQDMSSAAQMKEKFLKDYAFERKGGVIAGAQRYPLQDIMVKEGNNLLKVATESPLDNCKDVLSAMTYFIEHHAADPDPLLTKTMNELKGMIKQSIDERTAAVLRLLSYIISRRLPPLDAFAILYSFRRAMGSYVRGIWKDMNFAEEVQRYKTMDEAVGTVVLCVLEANRCIKDEETVIGSNFPDALGTVMLDATDDDALGDENGDDWWRLARVFTDSMMLYRLMCTIAIARSFCSAGIHNTELRRILGEQQEVQAYDIMMAERLCKALVPICKEVMNSAELTNRLLSQPHDHHVRVHLMLNCVTDLYGYCQFMSTPFAMLMRSLSSTFVKAPSVDTTTILKAGDKFSMAKNMAFLIWNFSDEYRSLSVEISELASRFYGGFLSVQTSDTLKDELELVSKRLSEVMEEARAILKLHSMKVYDFLNPSRPVDYIIRSLIDKAANVQTSGWAFWLLGLTTATELMHKKRIEEICFSLDESLSMASYKSIEKAEWDDLEERIGVQLSLYIMLVAPKNLVNECNAKILQIHDSFVAVIKNEPAYDPASRRSTCDSIRNAIRPLKSIVADGDEAIRRFVENDAGLDGTELYEMTVSVDLPSSALDANNDAIEHLVITANCLSVMRGP